MKEWRAECWSVSLLMKGETGAAGRDWKAECWCVSLVKGENGAAGRDCC